MDIIQIEYRSSLHHLISALPKSLFKEFNSASYLINYLHQRTMASGNYLLITVLNSVGDSCISFVNTLRGRNGASSFLFQLTAIQLFSH